MKQLKIENLNFKYAGERSDFSLCDVSLEVQAGEFILLCGQSGSGKSTLLRLLKPEISPNGTQTGSIYFNGELLDNSTPRAAIGMVFQNPEDSLVTDKVSHEMAFSLECLGLDASVIGRRIAETASYFGIDALWDRDIHTLSGGERQLLSLAAALVSRPSLLLLDEPCSSLDPIAAEEFISTLKRLNSEFGITVIISEHRLDKLMPISDRVIAIENGRIICNETPREAAKILRNTSLCPSLPIASQIYFALGAEGEDIPLDVRECRTYLEKREQPLSLARTSVKDGGDAVISAKNISFRYEKSGRDILCGLDVEIEHGLFTCIMGGNGAGKSTLLSCLCGLEQVYEGKITYNGKNIRKYKGELWRENISLLMQSAKHLFSCETVRAELMDVCKAQGLDTTAAEQRIDEVSKRLGICALLDRHPYDLSGGEMQKAALSKLLLGNPRVLLLDEPTQGLDASFKAELLKIITDLCDDGVTVIAVTHDTELAAYADRCMMMFGGKLTSGMTPHEFFSENFYYTTATSRITRGFCEGAVRVTDICGGENE